MRLYFDLIFWEIRQMCENDKFRIHLLNCGTCKEKVVSLKIEHISFKSVFWETYPQRLRAFLHWSCINEISSKVISFFHLSYLMSAFKLSYRKSLILCCMPNCKKFITFFVYSFECNKSSYRTALMNIFSNQDVFQKLWMIFMFTHM